MAAAASAQDTGRRNAATQQDKPYVILISLDGFRPDYLKRGLTPMLDRLAVQGATTAAMRPSFPSKTFPNHYTLVTGMYPGRHGIVSNRFYDEVLRDTFVNTDSLKVRESKWFGGEPVWVTAERQGMLTATYFWPGSEARIKGIQPSDFRYFQAGLDPAVQVDQALAWLQRPAATRPHLIAMYFGFVDVAGHRFGPQSAQVDSALVRADRVIARLIRAAERTPAAGRINYVIVSDHGMAPFGNWERLDEHAEVDRSMLVEVGPVLSLYLRGDSVRIRAVHAQLQLLQHARAYLRAELPARFHMTMARRAGDIVVVADSGWAVGLREWSSSPDAASHGWDPALRAMDALFIAHGPHVRNVRVEPFENIHVYRVVTDLLGLRAAPGLDGDDRVSRAIVVKQPVPERARSRRFRQ